MKKYETNKINEFKFPKFKIEKVNERTHVCKYYKKNDLFAYLTISLTQYHYPTEIPGLAYFTANMMKKSNKSMTSEHLDEYLESCGTSFSISVSHDSITILLKALPEYFEESIDVIIECLFNPAFKEDEIKKNKITQIANLQQDLNEPSFLCSQALNNLIFEGHFYSSPINGTIKALKSIKRDDCISFHNVLINNSKIDIIIGGKFNNKSIDKKLISIIQGFDNKKHNSFKAKKIDSIPSNKLIFIPKTIQQASLKIAKQTVSFKHKDSTSILFINTLFGGYFMSRLNALIREELGYTYGIYSRYTNYKLISLLSISSSIKRGFIYDSLQQIFNEMTKLSNNKITKEEFLLVKNYYLGSFLRSIETTPQIISKISAVMIHNLENNYYDNLYNKIINLNIDEIYPLQKKYFKPSGLNISIVGDKKHTLNQIKQLDEFEIIQKNKLL